MEVVSYINAQKILNNHLLDFIDNGDDSQTDFTNLIKDINNTNILTNKKELEFFLHLLILIW